MSTLRKFFVWPIAFTLLGLAGAFWLGWRDGGAAGALSFLMIGAVLAVLEISLSFDNAIVNANKLREMTDVWQRRFLTWGILIAVFGMRIVFPLAVVAIAAWISPIEALRMAAAQPDEYARIMEESHLGISAFGGTFLLMVALNFFIDPDKEIDWIGPVERPLRRLASLHGLKVAVVLALILGFGATLPDGDGATFLNAALWGLLVFLLVEVLGQALDRTQDATAGAATGGLGAFLYLETLDASFSFDGVIGAFALTSNLFLIAIGLGIGAFYVRAMTIMLVEQGTLSQFKYLEHGAFWSILILSVIMYAQVLIHVPEVITGLLGAGFIAMSLWSSIRARNRLRTV